MAEAVWILFDEYADRWTRGERPDVREYVERAGPAADELASLVERFLLIAPPPPSDADLSAALAAWRAGEPPLIELRRRRGRRRDDVVEAIVTRFALAPALREHVADRYHELETGRLVLARVDDGLLRTIAHALGAPVSDMLAWPGTGPLPATAPGAFLRSPGAIAEWGGAAARAARAAPVPPGSDVVDRLFGLA